MNINKEDTIHDKDDLDINMDLKTTLDESENKNQNNNIINNKENSKDDNDNNLNVSVNNSLNPQAPTSSFLPSGTTPSNIFSPFEWNKEYIYPFTNSIIPVQNPNKPGIINDILSTPKKEPINNKENRNSESSTNFNYQWLQNQNMYSSNFPNKTKSIDDNELHHNNPSVPPGLSVQTKSKVPPMFTNSTPSSATSDNFVSADIFTKIENQPKLNTPINPSVNNNELGKIDTISPNSLTNILKLSQQQQQQSQTQQLQPQSLPSSHLSTPIPLGLNNNTETPNTNLLNNPLFMINNSQSSNLPIFSNNPLTPQKQSSQPQLCHPNNNNLIHQLYNHHYSSKIPLQI